MTRSRTFRYRLYPTVKQTAALERLLAAQCELYNAALEDGRRLHLKGIGAVKLHLHRSIRGTPKAITVRREGRHWWASLQCVDVPARTLPATGRAVGIDLG